MRPAFLLVYVGLLWTVTAEGDPALVGTWVTKSRDVVTGPVCIYIRNLSN